MTNEKRLIYVEDVVEKIDREIEVCNMFIIRDELDFLKGCLETIDTVDAVEVVRCKDCKHWSMGYCNHFAYYSYEPITDEDDFCSYGERREGE